MFVKGDVITKHDVLNKRVREIHESNIAGTGLGGASLNRKIRIVNDTAADLSRGEVFELTGGATDEQYVGGLGTTIDSDTQDSRVLIASEGIGIGETGFAVTDGLINCLVQLTNFEHEFAYWSSASVNLASRQGGSRFRLIHKLNEFTTTERDALTPATNDVIFNSTTDQMENYNGTIWVVTTSEIVNCLVLVESPPKPSYLYIKLPADGMPGDGEDFQFTILQDKTFKISEFNVYSSTGSFNVQLKINGSLVGPTVDDSDVNPIILDTFLNYSDNQEITLHVTISSGILDFIFVVTLL